MGLILRWLANTVALFVVASLVPHFHWQSVWTLLIAGAVLGLLNTLVKPILVFLTLPLTIVTFGLFLIVVNAVILELVAKFAPGFAIDGFRWALVGAIVLSLVSLITNRIGAADRRK